MLILMRPMHGKESGRICIECQSSKGIVKYLKTKFENIYNIYQLILIQQQMEGGSKNLQLKKLYETVLTNATQIQLRKEAVLSLIKMSIADHSNFSFLLNQIDWFSQTNLQLLPLLAKVLRAYRGTSKNASKVIYNLLAEGLSIPKANIIVVDLIVNIANTYKDSSAVIQNLRQNYPHKVCCTQTHVAYLQSLLALTQKLPSQRFSLLEIVIENTLAFDTEMTLGEKFMNRFQFEDQDVLALCQQCTPYQLKYDEVLSRIMQYFSKFDNTGKEILLKQLYLIFQKTIIQVDNIKMIQYLIFYLAQTSSQISQCFITLLMVSILQNYNSKLSKKRTITLLQFLRSYLNRSTKINSKKIKSIFLVLINQFKQRLDLIDTQKFEDLNVNQFAQENIFNLYILETIIYMKYKFPYVAAKANISQIYKKILEQSRIKLHYTTFIDENIVKLVNKDTKELPINNLLNAQNQRIRTKYVQKFIPIFLPKSQKFIQMKLNISQKRQRANCSANQNIQIDNIYGNIPSKKLNSLITSHGGLTPLTYQQFSM